MDNINAERIEQGKRLMDAYETLTNNTDEEREFEYHWADAIASILMAAEAVGMDLDDIGMRSMEYCIDARTA